MFFKALNHGAYQYSDHLEAEALSVSAHALGRSKRYETQRALVLLQGILRHLLTFSCFPRLPNLRPTLQTKLQGVDGSQRFRSMQFLEICAKQSITAEVSVGSWVNCVNA